MCDPMPNLDPPPIVSVCGRCGAKSDRTDDWTECADCRRLVCERCAQNEFGRYHADLCQDCAVVRELRGNEEDEAFTHATIAIWEYLADFDGDDFAGAASSVREIVSNLRPTDWLSDTERRNIRDKIRRMPLNERPWRKTGERT